jgi:hypothetical protein
MRRARSWPGCAGARGRALLGVDQMARPASGRRPRRDRPPSGTPRTRCGRGSARRNTLTRAQRHHHARVPGRAGRARRRRDRRRRGRGRSRVKARALREARAPHGCSENARVEAPDGAPCRRRDDRARPAPPAVEPSSEKTVARSYGREPPEPVEAAAHEVFEAVVVGREGARARRSWVRSTVMSRECPSTVPIRAHRGTEIPVKRHRHFGATEMSVRGSLDTKWLKFRGMCDGPLARICEGDLETSGGPGEGSRTTTRRTRHADCGDHASVVFAPGCRLDREGQGVSEHHGQELRGQVARALRVADGLHLHLPDGDRGVRQARARLQRPRRPGARHEHRLALRPPRVAHPPRRPARPALPDARRRSRSSRRLSASCTRPTGSACARPSSSTRRASSAGWRSTTSTWAAAWARCCGCSTALQTGELCPCNWQKGDLKRGCAARRGLPEGLRRRGGCLKSDGQWFRGK